MILNGELLEEVDDCFKYLGLQVAADGGYERDVVHRMNEGYRARGVLKSVLSNRGLGIKAKKCLYEGVIVPTMLYGAEAWGMSHMARRVFMAEVSGGWVPGRPRLGWMDGVKVCEPHDVVVIHHKKGTTNENQGTGVKYIG